MSLRATVRDPNSNGHQHAERIIRREHFKRLYSANPSDRRVNLESGRALAKALGAEFGDENFVTIFIPIGVMDQIFQCVRRMV